MNTGLMKIGCAQFTSALGHISTLRRPSTNYEPEPVCSQTDGGQSPNKLGQMNVVHTPLLQSSSLEDWGSPETPSWLLNLEWRVLGEKHEDLGILGTREVLDAWHWPEKLEHYLCPASRRGSRKVN